MKSFLTALLVVSVAGVCQARVGETPEQVQTDYGKPIKTAKPIAPATSASVYQKGSLGYYVGYLDGKAVYETFQTVEDDGDFGEDAPKEKQIEDFLKANNADGDFTEVKGEKGPRQWKSASGKLVASYDKKHKAVTIETAEFHDKRTTKK